MALLDLGPITLLGAPPAFLPTEQPSVFSPYYSVFIPTPTITNLTLAAPQAPADAPQFYWG